ncbi:poliovirus receptor, partial [Silurus asotus]
LSAIRVIGQDVTVTEGDDAQLFCQVVETSDKLTSITWQRRTNKEQRNKDFFAVTSDGKERQLNGLGDRVKFTGTISGLDGSIILGNVSVLDEGTYTCVFSVFPSGPYETEIYLTVQVAPVVSVGTDLHPVSGQTQEILATCTAANSKPSAEVSWNLGTLRYSFKVHTNHTVDSEGRHTVTSNLIGTASTELNQKKVQCLVSHPGLKEKKQLEYTLNIYYPPQLVYINLTSQGETCEFQCDVDANPKPSHFNWSR